MCGVRETGSGDGSYHRGSELELQENVTSERQYNGYGGHMGARAEFPLWTNRAFSSNFLSFFLMSVK